MQNVCNYSQRNIVLATMYDLNVKLHFLSKYLLKNSARETGICGDVFFRLEHDLSDLFCLISHLKKYPKCPLGWFDFHKWQRPQLIFKNKIQITNFTHQIFYGSKCQLL